MGPNHGPWPLLERIFALANTVYQTLPTFDLLVHSLCVLVTFNAPQEA